MYHIKPINDADHFSYCGIDLSDFFVYNADSTALRDYTSRYDWFSLDIYFEYARNSAYKFETCPDCWKNIPPLELLAAASL